MNLQEIPIIRLIPQRPPFVMVDKVISCDKVYTETQTTVRPDNIFLDDGMLAEAGIIENMAQSCAARMGCVNMLRNEPIRIGYIGDMRDCEIYRRPKCDEVMSTQIEILEEVFNLTMADVSTRIGDEVIAKARIKIALTEIEIIDHEPI